VAVCASCKAENPEGSAFCLECGTAVSAVVEASAARASGRRSKWFVLVAAALVVGLAGGAALALSGVLEPVVGKRFTQAEMDEETDASYDLGRKEGFSAGYSSGTSDGYTQGYAAGCDRVFDLAGYDQVIGIYYPYRVFNTGDFYITRSYAC
jgi:hypothetical protein